MNGHGVLVEVEAEETLVVEVLLLLDVEVGSVSSIELLGDGVGAVVEVLEKVGLQSISVGFNTKSLSLARLTEMVR